MAIALYGVRGETEKSTKNIINIDSMLIGFDPETFVIQGDGLTVNSDIWRFVSRSGW